MMLTENFFDLRDAIENQYRDVRWVEESGLPLGELEREIYTLCDTMEREGASREITKARMFELTLDKAQLAVEPKEYFQDHINHGFFLQHVRGAWQKEVLSTACGEVFARNAEMAQDQVMHGACDFGHTVPDWYDVLGLGLPGLLHRVEKIHAEKAGTLSREQEDFYTACEIVYRAAIRYVKRLAALCEQTAKGVCAADADRLTLCAEVLYGIADHAPQTTHEALQLTYIFHILQEEIEGERLRSLGGLDRE